MKRILLTAFVLLLGALFLSACQTQTDPGPAGTDGAKPAGTDSAAPVKGNSPIGTWYEQEENGGVLEVTKNKIRYTPASGTYVDEAPLKIVKTLGGCDLETNEEDYFWYVDIVYDQKEDMIEAHTMPVLDGDGGYKLRTFLRVPYEAPPPPVYDPPTDNSDPDAPKDFDDMTVRSMHVSFYDKGTYHDPSSNMAACPPYPDEYSYDLEVQEDGTALVSSSFCHELTLPAESMAELQDLVSNADLGSINGVDIHTEGMPFGTDDYTLELELASGETIRSSANGPDVPAAWMEFQRPMHYLLYFAFVNAGYEYSGYGFHPTAPMKRLGTGSAPARISWRKMLEQADYGYGWLEYEDEDESGDSGDGSDAEELNVSYDSVRIEPDWPKAYDYDLHTQYLVFEDVEPAYPELMKTLQQLNAEYRAASERSLQEDYEMMEAVPAKIWKNADRRYCYSFFTVAHGTDHGLFYSVLVSEGHANSLGVGKYGYGHYPNIQYNISKETGQIISVADLFKDKETALEFITDSLVNSWGTHNEEGKFIHSDEFPAKLAEFIDKTGRDGINWNAYYGYLELYFPTSLFTMSDTSVREVLYYEDLQDVLSDEWTTVW